MSTQLFNVTIKYNKTMENGFIKAVSEQYLVQAMSFTEVETRAVKEFSPYASGDFAISKINKARIVEVVEDNTIVDPKFYKVKIALVTLDEKNGIEKRTTINILVQASDIKDAHDRVVKRMSSSMADYIITSVAETPIIDYYKWQEEKYEQHQD